MDSHLVDPEVVQQVLCLLDDLHRWELDNIPVLRTMTGRDVYLALARLSGREEFSGVSLKSIKHNNHYTDKAIAKRLAALQAMDLVRTEKVDSDGRVKLITPEKKLHAYFERHSVEFLQIISKYFTLISK